MSIHEIFGLLAITLGAIGTVHYYIGIFQRRIKPHAFSWIIWALISSVIGMAQLFNGGGVGAWVTLLSACVAACTAVLALKFGNTDITKSDRWSFVVALCAIPLWYFTSNPFSAVILLTVIDLFGFYPSFRKGYHKPWEEGAFLFGVVTIKFALSALALEEVTLTTALYPSILVVANGIFTVMLLARRRVVPKGENIHG